MGEKENQGKLSNFKNAISKFFTGRKTNTSKDLQKNLQNDSYICSDKEEARELLMASFLDFCRINKQKFDTSSLGEMVKSFGGHISGSILYKESYRANDIDIFFTEKQAYEEFLSFLEKSVGKENIAYGQKRIAPYTYLDDKSRIEYKGQKLDVNLVTHLEEIEETLAKRPEIMDYFLDLFKTTKAKKEEETVIDTNKFNPDTKSFGLPVKREKRVDDISYKIPKNRKLPLNKSNQQCSDCSVRSCQSVNVTKDDLEREAREKKSREKLKNLYDRDHEIIMTAAANNDFETINKLFYEQEEYAAIKGSLKSSDTPDIVDTHIIIVSGHKIEISILWNTEQCKRTTYTGGMPFALDKKEGIYYPTSINKINHIQVQFGMYWSHGGSAH